MNILKVEMLKDRQKTVLRAAILEHIKTARPVASQELVGEDLGVSPATIRSEMLRLDGLGYLAKPHTSAGRIPTDKGYRFFVDNLAEEFFLTAREIARIKNTFAEEAEEEFIKEMARMVSSFSGTFAAAGIFEEDLFFDTGLSEILAEPEMRDIASVRVFGRLVDFLAKEPERMSEMAKDEEERIFIGEENPFREARDYAMFLSSWKHPAGFSGFLTMISPKRTNYPRNKALLESIKNFQNESR